MLFPLGIPRIELPPRANPWAPRKTILQPGLPLERYTEDRVAISSRLVVIYKQIQEVDR